MKKLNRAQLRGKPLYKFCKRAKISKHEYGPNDQRCFCYGMVDMDGDSIDECRECRAYSMNATPLEGDGDGE